MQLQQIPKLIDLLEQRKVITPEQKATLLQDVDRGDAGRFAGEYGLDRGYYSRETLDAALNEQASRRAEAAVKDLQHLFAHGKSELPYYLQPQWGNNGVSRLSGEATLADGMSAAANMAQNIVLLLNQPEVGQLTQSDQKLVADAVSAAANLVRGMKDGPSARVPVTGKGESWLENVVSGLKFVVQKIQSLFGTPDLQAYEAASREDIDTLQKGLRRAVEIEGSPLKDQRGQPVNLEDYLQARTQEAEAGLALSAARESRQQSFGRS
jgi:hypothetical protein